MYYEPDIQPLSDSDPLPPEQPASTTEAPAATLDLPASVEGPTVSRQDAGQGEKVEASLGKAPVAAPSQFEQMADHQAPKTKALDICFSVVFFFFFFVFYTYHTKDLYCALIINESIFFLFYVS